MGPQLTAGATVLQLCWVELRLKNNTNKPTSDAGIGSNYKKMLRNKTFSLIVLAILEAVMVMTFTSHHVQGLNAPALAHASHAKYLHQATCIRHAATHTH